MSLLDKPRPVAAADAGRGGDAKSEPFLNRELSWLQFNRRVLHEALDPRTPLLERVRFLCIFTSNLDEFFMKRVGALRRQAEVGVMKRAGLSPQAQLAAIRRMVHPMLVAQAECFRHEIRPALRDEGIHLLEWSELPPDERRRARDHFTTDIFPVLTPLAVDPGHPFPFISNLSLSLGITLRHPDSRERLFARVKVPDTLPQWVRLDEAGSGAGGALRFIGLRDIICHNLEALFPRMEVLGVMPFRVTRNADVERDEEDADDLLEMIEQELRRRRMEKVVRLELGPASDPWQRRFIMEELQVGDADVYEMPAELDYTGLGVIAGLGIPRLKYEPWTAVTPAVLADEEADIFAAIRRRDLLVHHPYEDFATTAQRFIRAAADDPDVLAIKMTMYRTGDDSPFVDTLIRAAEGGKQVACLVELKARFDERRNVHLAQQLEQAGVHVVYGLVGYKTHCKTALVVRREADGLRSYVHIGTGNYHTGTSRLYTDLGLFTAKRDFTGDVLQLFNHLTGRSLNHDYRKLLVAPVNMEPRFLEMIDAECAHARAGRPARIIAKVNSLEHRAIGRALYRASDAGVAIDLIVRGFCCIRPGVAGMSERIRVISVIGRFLEHSRLFYFQAGADDPLDGRFYFGSADWMYRNLRARVEAIVPIEDRALRQRCWQILELMLADQRQAWDMDGDGAYVQRQPAGGDEETGTHRRLMQLHRGGAAVAGATDGRLGP